MDAERAKFDKNYRKSILDSATAVEVCFSFLVSKQLPFSNDLNKYVASKHNSLRLKRDLLKALKISIPIKEEAYTKLCQEADEIKKSRGEELVNFNVSGRLFTTKLKTLLNVRDTFFYKMVHSGEFNMKETIELDRNPKFFLMVLDYLRFRNIDVKRLNKDDKADLRFEAQYFEITELCNQLGEFNAKLEILEFEYSGKYAYKDQVAGTGRLEDLTDKSLQKGICANTPGWIVFTLNDEFSIKEIDIGGFCGNNSLWNATNGEGGTIQTSVDKVNWKTVGAIPTGFGSEIKTVFLSKSSGKYLKFSSTSYLGIGYLSIRAENS